MCKWFYLVGLSFFAVIAFTNRSDAQLCHLPPFSIFRQLDSNVIVTCRVKSVVKPNPKNMEGKMVLEIEQVLRGKMHVRDRKPIIIHYYEPRPERFLVALHHEGGKLEVNQVAEIDDDGEMERIARRIMRMSAEPSAVKLEFLTKHLHHANESIRKEVAYEYAWSSHDDIATVGAKLTLETLRKIEYRESLREYPSSHVALLLAYSKKKEFAPTIKRWVDKRRIAFQMETNLYLAYVLSNPKLGWKVLADDMTLPGESNSSHAVAIQSAARIHESHPGLLPDAQVIDRMVSALQRPDLCHLVLSHLAKWKCWDQCDAVMALQKSPKHQSALIAQGIAYYCIRCPKAEAKAYIEHLRTSDPRLYEQLTNDLKAEQTSQQK